MHEMCGLACAALPWYPCGAPGDRTVQCITCMALHVPFSLGALVVLQETGLCPVTGESLTAEELVPIKSNKASS